MEIRDRIKELRRVRAFELQVNPKNWRKHPKGQRDALGRVLQAIGYADALLARETPDGLVLVDGHLRAEVTPDTMVPVLVLDITEEESDVLLASIDPIAAMATTDERMLKELLESIDDTQLVESIAKSEGVAIEEAAGGEAPAIDDEDVRAVISFTLIFEDKDQRDTWYSFMKILKEKYPDFPTLGARLQEYITAEVLREEDS